MNLRDNQKVLRTVEDSGRQRRQVIAGQVTFCFVIANRQRKNTRKEGCQTRTCHSRASKFDVPWSRCSSHGDRIMSTQGNRPHRLVRDQPSRVCPRFISRTPPENLKCVCWSRFAGPRLIQQQSSPPTLRERTRWHSPIRIARQRMDTTTHRQTLTGRCKNYLRTSQGFCWAND